MSLAETGCEGKGNFTTKITKEGREEGDLPRRYEGPEGKSGFIGPGVCMYFLWRKISSVNGEFRVAQLQQLRLFPRLESKVKSGGWQRPKHGFERKV